MQTNKQKIGDIGENLAEKFLVKQGYTILDRNYRKKWGEIDIVAESFDKTQDNKILHFIEVKTVSLKRTVLGKLAEVGPWQHMPEENIHLWKRKRLGRTIQTYILEKKVSDETDWQIDIMAVFLDFGTKKAKIRMTENVIL